MAAGVHGGRRAGILRAALRAARSGSGRCRDARCWRLAVCVPGAALAARADRGGGAGLCLRPDATARAPPIETDLPTHATIVTGTIRAVEALPEGRRITIQPAWLDGAAEPLRRSVRVRLQKKDDGELASGDKVRIRALVRPPAPPSYPGGWDLQRDAFYSGLGASGYALGKAERTAQAVPSGPMRFMQWLRETIAGRVVAVIPGAAGAVSVTLLTGASMAIPEADHAAFRDSGLAHLLAVAGLHIGIVMGFALTLSRFGFSLSERASLFWPTKKLAALCALAAGGCLHGADRHARADHPQLRHGLPVHRGAAGGPPAVFVARAGVWRPSVLMLIAPQEVPGVSFQMSFSAVLALISGYEALRPWLRRLHGDSWQRRLLSHLVALALTSALAGTASAPYGAYHFGHVQVYFVLANMVAVPLTAMWVMPAGLDRAVPDAAASGVAGAGADGLGGARRWCGSRARRPPCRRRRSTCRIFRPGGLWRFHSGWRGWGSGRRAGGWRGSW